MKKGLLLALLFTGLMRGVAQAPKNDTKEQFRVIENKSFKPGEFLKYRVYYGLVDAGIATLHVEEEVKTIAGRKVYHIVGTGESRGAFDWFYKVRDRYETYMDAEGLFPWLFVRRVDEGGFRFSQDYKFFQHKNKIDNGKGKVFDAPDYIQDMISAFYFARTMELDRSNIGDTITVKTFVDDEIFPLRIRFAGIENVKVGKVTFNCLKFHPVVQKGRIFKKEDDLSVWITNDANKIPIYAEAKILVGAIKMELLEWKGLATPPAIVNRK